MAKKCYKCKNEVPDGTKKCPTCGWEDRSGSRTGKKEEFQPTITLFVSRPEKLENGNFKVFAYAIVRKPDGSLVEDGQRVFFHTDNIEEIADDTGDAYGQTGRADCDFEISASLAGETINVTAHTQLGNKRIEVTKPVPIPRKKEEPKEEPHSLTVTPFGKDSKYSFDIWVTSSTGNGVVTEVSAAEGGIKKGPFPTNKDGYYHHEAEEFEEGEREFLIQAGPKLIYRVSLKGKDVAPKKRKRVKILKGQGFLANFLNVIHNGEITDKGGDDELENI